jgi:photosystem II stability/assembly factor-like uncharacterized protein
VLLVASDAGLCEVEGNRALLDEPVTALAATIDGPDAWVIVDRREVVRVPLRGGGPQQCATGQGLTALLPVGGMVLVGTAGAHVLRLDDHGWGRVESFERVDGRDDWYTPWGGAPDVRSLAARSTDEIFVNVHVGGVARSSDGGETWSQTIDMDTDVHQVLVDQAGRIHVATGANGYGQSDDGGHTWTFHNNGLHATYARAVATTETSLFVTTSTGPFSDRAALYRRPIDAMSTPFERCTEGLPDWFDHNIDTHKLTATPDGRVAVVGDEGDLYVSYDDGQHWQRSDGELGPSFAAVWA